MSHIMNALKKRKGVQLTITIDGPKKEDIQVEHDAETPGLDLDPSYEPADDMSEEDQNNLMNKPKLSFSEQFKKSSIMKKKAKKV